MVRERRYKGEDVRALVATFLFSAMSLLEGITMLGTLVVSTVRTKLDKRLQMPFWDTARAHFFRTAQRGIYVDLLEEEHVGEHCGLLVESIYQTQNASELSQNDYT